MGHHLKLRGSMWHWRINVPPDLREQLGRYELSRSTGTGDKRLATRYSMKWTAEAKEHFEELRNGEVSKHFELVGAARRVLRDHLQNLPRPDGDLEAFEIAMDAELDFWRGVIDPTVFPSDVGHVQEHVHELAAKYGLVIPPGSSAEADFIELIARAMVQVYVIAKRRGLHGDFTAQPWDDLGPGSADGNPGPAPARQFLARPQRTPMASEMFDKWLEEGSRKWARRTVIDYRIGRDVMLDILGDLPVSEIGRDDIRSIRDHLMKLPPRWRRMFPDSTIAEIMATEPPGPYLKPATIQRYLQAISGMLRMCLDDGLVDRNVAVGLTHVHDPEPANRKRLAWDIERLNQWFSWTIYDEPVEDWAHFQWLPLLGLYTGARVEELARLRVEDVKSAKDVLVLDIQWREGESLKTKAAERVVPVHSALLKAGFDKYVRRVRRRGGEHLWPTLRRSRAVGTWSPNFSKWFTRARRQAGVYHPKLNFHSFRGNFTTGLLNAGVPLERVQALVGHKAQGVTMGVYAKDVDVKLLRGDIEKLEYEGFDGITST